VITLEDRACFHVPDYVADFALRKRHQDKLAAHQSLLAAVQTRRQSDEVVMTDRVYVANACAAKNDKLIPRQPAMTITTQASFQ
jgi:hypothetical protein